MKKNVFVNATSATEGGTLTILNQFIDKIHQEKNENIKYYIFVPTEISIKSNKYIEIVHIKGKKYIDRIIWDMFGIKRWAISNKIHPVLIISLQNTAVRFKDAKQIIYLHQSLQYYKDIKWNIFDKNERKMWFYKNIYKVWIDMSIKKDHYIIVQTNWMKEALLSDNYMDDKVIVAMPSVNNLCEEDVLSITKKEGEKYLFYPAGNYKYKNHDIIIEAINELKNKNKGLVDKIKIFFTIDENSDISQKIKRLGIEEIVCLGKLDYKDVLKLYKSSDIILFPSYVETVGLPLLEAAIFGKKIIVSDRPYSREVLNTYDNVEFIKYDDKHEWCKVIESNINNKNKNSDNRLNYKDGWNTFINLIYDLTVYEEEDSTWRE